MRRERESYGSREEEVGGGLGREDVHSSWQEKTNPKDEATKWLGSQAIESKAKDNNRILLW